MRENETGGQRRKSDFFLLFLAASALLFCAAFGHAVVRRNLDRRSADFNRSVVARYALTDLCLFTEARYARHPSQSDFHTPFQDHPASLEHFPAGAMAGIPPQLKEPR